MAEEDVQDAGEVEPEDVEQRARQMGWVPQEEFRGDPERWVDAETFVERGENELPIARERMRKLEKDLQNKDQELSEVKKSVREMTQQMGQYFRGQHEQTIEAKKRERDEAVEEGDTERYQRLNKELETLEQKKPEVPEPPEEDPNGWTPEFRQTFEAWKAENDWYESDPLLSSEFAQFHDHLLQVNPSMDDEQRLKKAEQAVKEKYPQKFGAKAGKKGSPVEGGTQRKGSKKKGYDDLPDDAKKAYDKFVTRQKIMSGDEYLKDFFGEEYEG